MISLQGIVPRAVYAVFTLYMMLILIRWAGPYLQLDFYNPRLRWIVRLTDPLLNLVRRYVPHIGVFDISLMVALLIVYALRQVVVGLLANVTVM